MVVIADAFDAALAVGANMTGVIIGMAMVLIFGFGPGIAVAIYQWRK